MYPGITNKIADEIAEVLFLNPEEDFSLAYSPERISPGDIGKSASDVARIVGSNDPMVGAELAEMYSKITAGGCTHVGPIEVAEAAKMVENTQRDIDIAFVNELAVVLPKMGVDVRDVLDAAETKWNFHRHDPGIGVGGHCIPVDPYYYIQFSEMAGSKSMMSPIAREINESMPKHAAGIISSKLPDRGGILILGTSYKPNVGDIRETPVFPLIRELLEAGFRVHAWDPINQEDDYLPNGCKHHISSLMYQREYQEWFLQLLIKSASLDWGRLLSDIEELYFRWSEISRFRIAREDGMGLLGGWFSTMIRKLIRRMSGASSENTQLSRSQKITKRGVDKRAYKLTKERIEDLIESGDGEIVSNHAIEGLFIPLGH